MLLVPPLAAPAICFDLRRGCSLAEHLVVGGRRTYLLEYGGIEFRNRDLGLEHWIEDVIPNAVRAAADDAGRPVRLIGWCLGGIMSLLAHAMDGALPIEAAALVASPFDFSKVPLVAPLRPIDAVTRGHLVTQLYRALGGAPAPLVKRGYQIAGIDKYVMKPWTMVSNAGDRDLLAQIEAVDAFMGRMHAYPGRTFGQLYHRFFRTNDLANGQLALTDRTIDLADVTSRCWRSPVAGRDRARARVSPRRRPGAERHGAARDRAGRPPRRAHGPRRARDHLGAARCVPERQVRCAQVSSRAVLITGCSSGIGHATAAHLADKGWTVYATARRPETLGDLEAKGCKTLALDVTDEASCAAAVAAVEAAEGAVGVLINNAGYSQSGAVEIAYPIERVRAQFETNVFGLLGMCRSSSSPECVRQGWGKIVNVSLDGRAVHVPGRRDLSRDQARGRGALRCVAVRGQGLRRRRDHHRAGDHPHQLRRDGGARDRRWNAGSRSRTERSIKRWPTRPRACTRKVR